MIETKLHRQSNCLSIVKLRWIPILEQLRKKYRKGKEKENRRLQEESWNGKKRGK